MIELTDIQNDICANLLLLKSADRDTLMIRTKIPRTTIFDNLQRLEKLGIVQKKSDSSNGKPGRPPVLWFLNKDRVRVRSKP